MSTGGGGGGGSDSRPIPPPTLPTVDSIPLRVGVDPPMGDPDVLFICPGGAGGGCVGRPDVVLCSVRLCMFIPGA